VCNCIVLCVGRQVGVSYCFVWEDMFGVVD